MRGAIREMTLFAMPGGCFESLEYQDRGTLGIIAIDKETTRKVALTAMHIITGVNEYPSDLHPYPIEFQAGCSAEQPPLLGRLMKGTRQGVDAAMIALDEGVEYSNYSTVLGRIDRWRAASTLVTGQTVRMAGAASGGLSLGTIVNPAVPAPQFGLDSAILVEMRAIGGDSGAPLVDLNGVLVGLLVGGNSSRQLFNPIDAVFDTLGCELY